MPTTVRKMKPIVLCEKCRKPFARPADRMVWPPVCVGCSKAKGSR